MDPYSGDKLVQLAFLLIFLSFFGEQTKTNKQRKPLFMIVPQKGCEYSKHLLNEPIIGSIIHASPCTSGLEGNEDHR